MSATIEPDLPINPALEFVVRAVERGQSKLLTLQELDMAWYTMLPHEKEKWEASLLMPGSQSSEQNPFFLFSHRRFGKTEPL